MKNAIRFTGAVPVFASKSVKLAEAPTVVLAKVRLEGLTWRYDCAPMPVKFAVSGRVVSEVAMATVPVRVPACNGVNVTRRLQLAAEESCAPAAGQLPETA